MSFLSPSPARAPYLLSIAALIILAPLACAPPPAADAGSRADPPPSAAAGADKNEPGATDVTAPAAIFIVRHAEKETGDGVGRDPNLDDAGRERASTALVELLDGAAIDATEIETYWDEARSTQQAIDRMRDARRVAKSAAPQLRPVVYSTTFPWLEGLAV
ncbi:MAG: hypothetical protein AAGF23_02190, partial [Acidobacteriota bacterium]